MLESITSSSAALISGEVYSFCLVCPSFLLHTDVVLIVRAATSRVCYRSILNSSNQILPWHALNRAPGLFCANFSVSRPCFPLRLRRWLKTPRNCFKEEAASFKTQLQADLTEIRALRKQLVMGMDEEDAADIAAADRIRVDALHALEAFLQ